MTRRCAVHPGEIQSRAPARPAPIPCAHWSDCGVNSGGCCSLPAARKQFGARPSRGVCLRACQLYDGPDRSNLPNAEPLIQSRIIRAGDRPHGLRVERRDIGTASAAARAKAYVRAEMSLLTMGPVIDEIRDARLTACGQCPARQPAEDHPGWCRDCRCGTDERARLETKALMPAATCPRRLWPRETTAKGPAALEELGGRVEQVRQMVASVGRRIFKRKEQRDG